MLNFFDNSNKKLLLFSEIIIMFLGFFLIMPNEKILDKVSIVLPDFEIIIKEFYLVFPFF